MRSFLSKMAKSKHTIVAVGASLTKGHCGFGNSYHPYTVKLSQLLDETFPGVYNVSFGGFGNGLRLLTMGKMEMGLQ